MSTIGRTWFIYRLAGKVLEDTSNAKGTICGTADDGILVYRYIPKGGREAQVMNPCHA